MLLAFGAFAQADSSKNEFYVGYSHQRFDGSSANDSLNGFEVAYTRSIHRFLGVKGLVSGAFGGNDFSSTLTDPNTGPFTLSSRYDRQSYNFAGGIQVKDFKSDSRLKPFAHALAGVAHNRVKVDGPVCTAGVCPPAIFPLPFDSTSSNFTMILGGGLDVKINRKVDLRLIQVDYNPVFRGFGTENNVRFGIGLVFK
jgi:hypothetical protein